MVKVYSTSWCPDCQAAKTALDAFGIEFTEIDIDKDPKGEELVLLANHGRRSVPTLVYGENAASMSRFSLSKLQTWLQEVGLD